MYLISVDSEIRSFKKTLRSFYKLNAKIRNGGISSKRGRKMRKVILLVSSAIVLLMLVFPPFRFPVDGAATSGFFFRQRPESLFALDLEIHKGVDFAAPGGTTVVPSAPGRVIDTGYSVSYGNYVRVKHLFGFETRYAHLSEISVKEGDFIIVRSLRPIGSVGSTGRSTGPHLHFETRLFGSSVPPRFFLVFHGIRKAILGF